jgi:peptide-N4-(N-acetyl-beta-glucosaminyl)asparagine amidase
LTGWDWKLAYCVAFSIDGATDVTRRYVRNPTKYGKERTKVPEPVLLWILLEIRKMRRENLSKKDKHRLIKEDEREEQELRRFMATSLAAQITRIIPTGNSRRVSARTDEQKAAASRDEAATGWLNTSSSDESLDPNPAPEGEG